MIPASAKSATSTNAVPPSPFYTFTLDTSTATQATTKFGGTVAGSSSISNVNIYNEGTLLGADTINFSLNTGLPSGTASIEDVSPTAQTPEARVLKATGEYAFEFDPATFATGAGNLSSLRRVAFRAKTRRTVV